MLLAKTIGFDFKILCSGSLGIRLKSKSAIPHIRKPEKQNFRSMKRTMYLWMMLSLSAYGFATDATDAPEFKVFKISEANAYRVIYTNPASGFIELEILNSKKRTLYRSVYPASRGIKLPLDFSELKNGQYFISVKDGKNFFIREITHVHEVTDFTFHAAPLASDPKKYLISIVAPAHTAVTLSVYDAHGKTLHQQNQAIRKQEALVLNLREFKGPFVFELTDAMGKRRAIQR